MYLLLTKPCKHQRARLSLSISNYCLFKFHIAVEPTSGKLKPKPTPWVSKKAVSTVSVPPPLRLDATTVGSRCGKGFVESVLAALRFGSG